MNKRTKVLVMLIGTGLHTLPPTVEKVFSKLPDFVCHELARRVDLPGLTEPMPNALLDDARKIIEESYLISQELEGGFFSDLPDVRLDVEELWNSYMFVCDELRNRRQMFCVQTNARFDQLAPEAQKTLRDLFLRMQRLSAPSLQLLFDFMQILKKPLVVTCGRGIQYALEEFGYIHNELEKKGKFLDVLYARKRSESEKAAEITEKLITHLVESANYTRSGLINLLSVLGFNHGNFGKRDDELHLQFRDLIGKIKTTGLFALDGTVGATLECFPAESFLDKEIDKPIALSGLRKMLKIIEKETILPKLYSAFVYYYCHVQQNPKTWISLEQYDEIVLISEKFIEMYECLGRLSELLLKK